MKRYICVDYNLHYCQLDQVMIGFKWHFKLSRAMESLKRIKRDSVGKFDSRWWEAKWGIVEVSSRGLVTKYMSEKEARRIVSLESI